MNTNKKTYITPAVKEYEMGTLSVFAGSAADHVANARRQIQAGGIWADSPTTSTGSN